MQLSRHLTLVSPFAVLVASLSRGLSLPCYCMMIILPIFFFSLVAISLFCFQLQVRFGGFCLTLAVALEKRARLLAFSSHVEVASRK
jgi:hypothetical protein